MASTPAQDDYVHLVLGGPHPSTYPPVATPGGAPGHDDEISGAARPTGPRASKPTFSRVFKDDGDMIGLLKALDKSRKKSGVIHVQGKPIPIKDLVDDASLHLTATAVHMIQYNIGTKRLATDYPDVMALAEKAQTQLNHAKGEAAQSFAKAYGSLTAGTNLAMQASSALSRHHAGEDTRFTVEIAGLRATKFFAFWGAGVIAMHEGGPPLALLVNELDVGLDTLEDYREGETFDWKMTGIDIIVGAAAAGFGKPIGAYLETAYKPMAAVICKKTFPTIFAHKVETDVMEEWIKELQEKAGEAVLKIIAEIASKTCEESVKKILHDLFSGEEGKAETGAVAKKLQEGLKSHLDSIIGGKMHAEAKRIILAHPNGVRHPAPVKAQ